MSWTCLIRRIATMTTLGGMMIILTATVMSLLLARAGVKRYMPVVDIAQWWAAATGCGDGLLCIGVVYWVTKLSHFVSFHG